MAGVGGGIPLADAGGVSKAGGGGLFQAGADNTGSVTEVPLTVIVGVAGGGIGPLAGLTLALYGGGVPEATSVGEADVSVGANAATWTAGGGGGVPLAGGVGVAVSTGTIAVGTLLNADGGDVGGQYLTLIVASAGRYRDGIALLNTHPKAANPITVSLCVAVGVGAVGVAGAAADAILEVPHAVLIIVAVSEGGVNLGAGGVTGTVDGHALLISGTLDEVHLTAQR